MKNKLVAIVLTVVCALVPFGIDAVTSFKPISHIETENISLEESLDEPVWGEIQRDTELPFSANDIEIFKALYGEDFNIDEIIENFIKAEEQKTVKNVKGDGKGNAIITYTNGKKETIQVFDPSYVDTQIAAAVANIKSNNTASSSPSSHAPSYNENGYHLEKKVGALPRVIASFAPNIDVELLDVDVNLVKHDSLDPDPNLKYEYVCKVTYLIHNSTSMPTHYKAKITLDNTKEVTMTSSGEHPYDGNLYVEKGYNFYTANPIYKAITDVTIFYE